MKALKAILIGLGVIILLLVIIAFILPSRYSVSRSIVIQSNDSIIYDLTSHLNKWEIWTAWSKASADSTAKFETKGEDGQVGTIRSWEGKKLGSGQLLLTDLKERQLVGYDLSLQEGEFTSKGKIVIEPLGDSCRVTWTDEGELGYNPMNRYFGLFMDRMMGPDFEKGLTKLKTVAEERKGWPEMKIVTLPDQVVLLIRDSAGPETYSEVMGKGFGEISEFIHVNKLHATGHPFAMFLRWDSVTMFSVMDIGMAVDSASVQPKGRVRIETYPAHKVLMTRYFGPYDQTAPYYYAMEKFCAQEGMIIEGGPMEIYVTDPLIEKDPLKVETQIVFPIVK